jgi:hypothetical protein
MDLIHEFHGALLQAHALLIQLPPISTDELDETDHITMDLFDEFYMEALSKGYKFALGRSESVCMRSVWGILSYIPSGTD